MREGGVVFGTEATERKYVLSCKVVIKKKGYVDYKKRQMEAELAYLIPLDGDQRVGFLTAWLPDTEEDSVECVGFIPYPVDSPCRFKVKRADENIDRHYLFVMSKGVEDILKKLDGRTIQVTILPEDEDEQGDNAKDTDQDIETFEE